MTLMLGMRSATRPCCCFIFNICEAKNGKGLLSCYRRHEITVRDSPMTLKFAIAVDRAVTVAIRAQHTL